MNDHANRLRLATRMAHIEPFEVMEIQTLAREVEARGGDVIHVEIGEPDFRTPQPIVEAAKRALDGRNMYYTSALGLMELREAISRFYSQRYGLDVPASRIIVTAGSSAALLLAFGVLLDPGDEVLQSDPGYPCNRHFARTLGAVPRLANVGPASRYQMTADVARRHWSERTRAALVATPANPTGTMLTREEIRDLAKLAREKDGTLIVDEIYHGLVYDGAAPYTALEAGDDVFVINSFSVLADDRLAAGMAGGAASIRAREVESSRRTSHLALRGGAARGARMLRGRDARRSSARRRGWTSADASSFPRWSRSAFACRSSRRARSTSTPTRPRSRPTASRLRARSSPRRTWRSRRGAISGATSPSATSGSPIRRRSRASARPSRASENSSKGNADVARRHPRLPAFRAIILLFAFLTTQAILIRGPLDVRTVGLIGRTDLWYFGSAFAVLVTGFLRATLGAKGPDFYFNSWPIYAKLALFVAVGVISVKPTMAFIQWRRELDKDASWQVPADERARVRKLLMIEVHLAALIRSSP